MYCQLKETYIHDKNPKVFCIGFNKTGTTSLHSYFVKNGYDSQHWYGGGDKLAVKMVDNIKNNKKILEDIPGTFFSDITWDLGNPRDKNMHRVDPSDVYKIIDLQYPNSMFILNIRPVDNWIDSRKNHGKGELFKNALDYSNFTEDELVDYWKHQYEFSIKDIELYFKNTGKLLIFDIENDDIENVNEFLRPYYECDKNLWSHEHKTVG
jgi:hypothetical protein